MEDLSFIFIGALIAFPIMYYVTKNPGKQAENPIKVGYVPELVKKFEQLLETSYKKDTKTYNELYSKLNEKEKEIFKLYMESNLGKDIDSTRTIDSTELARRDMCRWFVMLMIESAIVLAIAYMLFIYLKGRNKENHIMNS